MRQWLPQPQPHHPPHQPLYLSTAPLYLYQPELNGQHHYRPQGWPSQPMPQSHAAHEQHQSTWVTVPICIDLLLFFPLIAMADALPPKVRLCVLRYLGPAVCGCTTIIALTLRLPAAENTPGLVVWSVMGTDTVTNLEALTYSSTVLTLLLAKGVLRAWILPDQLAFITTKLRLATVTGASASDGPQESGARIAVGPMARSSIAPHPLVPSELA